MAGCFLDITQRDAGVERRGDERVTQGVWSDRLGDASLARESPYDAAGGVAVEAFAVGAQEDRSLGSFTDGEVYGASSARREGDGHGLAALAEDREGAVAALDGEAFDVRAGGLGDPQAIEGQQGEQGVISSSAQASSDEQGADLVAVQANDMGLVVQTRPAYMGSR